MNEKILFNQLSSGDHQGTQAPLPWKVNSLQGGKYVCISKICAIKNLACLNNALSLEIIFCSKHD